MRGGGVDAAGAEAWIAARHTQIDRSLLEQPAQLRRAQA